MGVSTVGGECSHTWGKLDQSQGGGGLANVGLISTKLVANPTRVGVTPANVGSDVGQIWKKKNVAKIGEGSFDRPQECPWIYHREHSQGLVGDSADKHASELKALKEQHAKLSTAHGKHAKDLESLKASTPRADGLSVQGVVSVLVGPLALEQLAP